MMAVARIEPCVFKTLAARRNFRPLQPFLLSPFRKCVSLVNTFRLADVLALMCVVYRFLINTCEDSAG